MIDTSKKPTAADIAYRARLLHSFAHTAALFAMDANYDDRAALDAMADHILLIDELCAELDIMAQVMDGYSKYTDFPELIPEECEKPKSRAQLMDELFDAFKSLADASEAQRKPEQPSEDRQRVNAAIIANLEKLGLMPQEEKDGEQE